MLQDGCIQSDPMDSDTDGDGLQDDLEMTLTSNPGDDDTDFDLLADALEYQTIDLSESNDIAPNGEDWNDAKGSAIVIQEGNPPVFEAPTITKEDTCEMGPLGIVCWRSGADLIFTILATDDAGIALIHITSNVFVIADEVVANLPTYGHTYRFHINNQQNWFTTVDFDITITDHSGNFQTRRISNPSLLAQAIQWLADQLENALRWIVHQLKEVIRPVIRALYPQLEFLVGDVVTEVASVVNQCGINDPNPASLNAIVGSTNGGREFLKWAVFVAAEIAEGAAWLIATIMTFGAAAAAREAGRTVLQALAEEFADWMIETFMELIQGTAEDMVDEMLTEALGLGLPEGLQRYENAGAHVFGTLWEPLKGDFDMGQFAQAMENNRIESQAMFMEADGAARAVMAFILVMVDEFAVSDALGPQATQAQQEAGRAVLDVAAMYLAVSGAMQIEDAPQWYENFGTFLRSISLTFVSTAEETLPDVLLTLTGVWIQDNIQEGLLGTCP